MPLPESWNFDTDTTGLPPSGWTIHSGTLLVQEDQYVSPLKSLKETAGSAMATAGEVRSDLVLEASVRCQAGGAPGVIFRFVDAQNFYHFRIHRASRTVELYKVVNGTWTRVAFTDFPSLAGVWHRLKVTVEGFNFQGYVDGIQVLPATGWLDLTGHEHASGVVGIRGYGASIYWYDDVYVEDYVGPPAPPPPERVLFDNCDSLTPVNGSWKSTGGVLPTGPATPPIVSIDTVNQLEGTGCIRCDCYQDDTAWIGWLYKITTRTALWDFTTRSVQRFRVYVPTQTNMLPITVALATGEGGGYYSHDYGELDIVPDQWCEFTIDVRYDVHGVPLSPEALASGLALRFQTQAHLKPFTFYVDFIEQELGAPIEPGDLIFVVSSEGSPVPEANVTVSKTSKLTDAFGRAEFLGMLPGNYSAKISKSGYFPIDMTVTVEANKQATYKVDVIATPKPVPPTALHTEGRWLVNKQGKRVILRGAVRGRWCDDPSGAFGGWTIYNPEVVDKVVSRMKDWGANSMRTFFAAEFWVNNAPAITPTGTMPFRDVIKDFLARAYDNGLYVFFGGWSVYGYPEGQDSVPFPPYCQPGHEALIPTEDDFVAFVVDIVRELGHFPNLIIEPWNEPFGGVAGAEDVWYRVWQKIINAVRAEEDRLGFVHHLIVMHFSYGCGYYGSPDEVSHTMMWVDKYPFIDPANNLLYSTHLYRDGGAVGTQQPKDTRPTDYDTCKKAYIWESIKSVGEKVPLAIPELGCYVGRAGEDEWLRNTYKILNEWKLGYLQFMWRDTGTTWDILVGNSEYKTGGEPNRYGQLLIDAIVEGQPPPTPEPCFVATVAFGSPLVFELNVLRSFRDRSLPALLVDVYYRVGPFLAELIKDRGASKRYVREALSLFVKLWKREAKWAK